MLQESRTQNEHLQPQEDNQSRLIPPELAKKHLLYDCPLYIWYASGWIRYNKQLPRMQWFVYVEYRDRFCASHYHVSEFETLAGALDFMEHKAILLELPKICPKQTRKQPIVKTITL
ncbi:hypothetical protein [Endozoicomonas sp.]|uniref:hypothetical protein n=1 Tax=Endozoicomonas sp. TaxID=1892382 RepID=UPI003D9AFEBE